VGVCIQPTGPGQRSAKQSKFWEDVFILTLLSLICASIPLSYHLVYDPIPQFFLATDSIGPGFFHFNGSECPELFRKTIVGHQWKSD
jgi:hypothetical protein